MKKEFEPLNLEELSAYLDGESENPDAMRLRIERDPDAARLAREWSGLSRDLGNLPAPKVHPAFSTRVMAHVRDSGRAGAFAGRFRWWAPIATASLAAAVIAVGWWAYAPPAVEAPVDRERALVRYVMERGDNAVIDDIAAMIAQEPSVLDEAFVEAEHEELLLSDSTDIWLDVLADAPISWESTDAVDVQDGLDSLLESLSDEEAAALMEWLVQETLGETRL